jgi:hypothetical protein
MYLIEVGSGVTHFHGVTLLALHVNEDISILNKSLAYFYL